MERISTHVVTADNGPRPAGKPDECFYCGEKIGAQHAPTCVCRKKTVVITYEVQVVCDVPEYWDNKRLLFHRNDSTWCSNNLERDIRRQHKHFAKTGKCWCDNIAAVKMRDANESEDFFSDAEMVR